jgi:hypothetical protein
MLSRPARGLPVADPFEGDQIRMPQSACLVRRF